MIVSLSLDERPWTLNKERAEHWRVHRRYTAKWREAFKAMATNEVAAGNRFDGQVTVIVRQEVGRKPMPDPGSCVGAAKAAIDGMVDAGLLPGDTGAVVRRLSFDAPRQTGCDRVTVIVKGVPAGELIRG